MIGQSRFESGSRKEPIGTIFAMRKYRICEVYKGAALLGDDVGEAATFYEALAIATASATKSRAIFLGADMVWPRDPNLLDNPKPKPWPRAPYKRSSPA